MMIQNAPDGEPRFICLMTEHMDLCRQFAEAFGNDRFEKPVPFEETVYAISHHDRGWDQFDANPVLDPKSGFPTGVGGAKGPGGAETTRLSPEFNEKRHAYSGLLASMHTWGLYNARYGYSDFRVRIGGSTSIPISPDMADETNGILEGEIARQNRLKDMLAADPATKDWVDEDRLFQNYKLLQFCDTLALYFNLRHTTERTEEIYIHVPQSRTSDASVTVKPLGDDTYSFAPFPFAGDSLDVSCTGRYFTALPGDEASGDLAAALQNIPVETQVHRFVAA
ncbi:MAG: DUF3891 family protein [Rhodospirillaceae bacterium]|jgi:hypothetical protein|nr:DUF3891 family protein [Rhodospirillaceae bacterium]MBT5458636.1 DUF3891 family protein [Rhodospirillaceae bacterium]